MIALGSKKTKRQESSPEPEAASPERSHNGRLSIINYQSLLVNLCRFILAATFIFSGFVKAVDPLGTQYKIQDYATAAGLAQLLPDWVALTLSVGLSALEFTLGICLLFAIQRRLVTRVSVALMAIMTVITFWLAVADPISDCGCFGDAIHLTNWQTFWKNIILLACAVVAALWPRRMMRLISETNQWIVVHYTILFVLFVSIYCLHYLPIIDFRPYHVGANIPEGMLIPDDAPQPQFQTTFIMQKDGQTREFTLEDYPDSTWTYVDTRTVQTQAGYIPPIHDLTMQDDNGDDLAEDILGNPSYTFLLISPHLETASDRHFGDIEQLYEYAQEHHYPFYCLTASTQAARLQWQDLTGAEYPFLATDEITLKTIIRSNPGLLLLHNGTIIRKWSHNDLPAIESSAPPLQQQAFGQPATDSKARTLSAILLWYAMPLLLLTLADRMWAWTQWFCRKKARDNQQS